MAAKPEANVPPVKIEAQASKTENLWAGLVNWLGDIIQNPFFFVMWRTLIFIATFFLTAFALPASFSVVRETRQRVPSSWERHSKPAGSRKLQLRIALRQPNVEQLYSHLLGVSHPRSPHYGQHWTAEEISKEFAPEEDNVDSVMQWLIASGINPDAIKQSPGCGWIFSDTTIMEAEYLLKTEYFTYKHVSRRTHLACSEYSLPAYIQQHVDLITPTLDFDVPIATRRDRVSKREVLVASGYSAGCRERDPVYRSRTTLSSSSDSSSNITHVRFRCSGEGAISQPWVRRRAVSDELQNCVHQITPNCLRALYQIPAYSEANPGNSLGIVEYTPQSYLPADLDNFFSVFAPEQLGQRPLLRSVDGGILQNFSQSFQYNSESDLDLEFAMALTYPQNVTLYQVGDTTRSATFSNFLDAIDSSSCNYPNSDLVGYQGTPNCGTFASTNVLSTSYGYNEADLTPAYMIRQCHEYAKLGLMGITVLYSSSDYGVAGHLNQCIDPTTHQLNNGSYGLFNPSFPSTCPYVTSIGATQIVPGGTVDSPEQACETVTYSGGGFSNVFGIPEYQQEAQQSYFTAHPPSYGADRFNNSRSSRGYPDVSANGANYVVNVDGVFRFVYGTSAATPLFGAIITQINEARLTAGKSPVGFINPALYANSDILNDITLGSNPGCATGGFNATEGWDPVTGLGTPNFPKTLDMFMKLP